MIGLIGKKIKMINIFIKGKLYTCTVIKTEKGNIINIKKSKLLLGYIKVKKVNKPLMGFFKKYNSKYYKKIIEFNKLTKNEIKYIKNKKNIDLDIFNIGEKIDITGYSLGKGFQGVVKRHNFSGVGSKTHGQHNRLRSPGSIGAGTYPAKVIKGLKMAGRMGNKKVTVKKIKILLIKDNILLVNGSVPGKNNKYLIIKKKYGEFNKK
ncbi:50S ribosomal protein L3 [Candidatus Shikimatogenerans bostrichidophilus]|uniref:50S ribosomal protein L3 n=1 Tax=Candidatus Shikimatogenerans bostrichidophilus TaxID=2943807 RepID=UPI0029672114